MPQKSIKNILLLLIGAFFLYFSNGRYSFALAAWLFPIFFLQVSRKEKSIFSIVYIPLLFGFCCQLSFWKFTSDNPSSIFFYLPFILGLPMGLLFYFDHILYPKLNGFQATLIFPLLFTSFNFLLNLFNPFGTLGVLGYSQFDFLAFAQLASITGMWGLTFMITWFGSVIYWGFENYSEKQKVQKGLFIYFSILLIILTYGSIRLIMPLENGTIKIAGIHAHDKRNEGFKMNEFLEKNDTILFKKISDRIIQNLINETIIQAKAGAKIVVWSEISSKILKQNEDSLNLIFKNLTKSQQIYLITNPYFVVSTNKLALSSSTQKKLINPGSSLKPENKILLYSPKGELILTHFKYGGNFLEGTVEGNKKIKSVKTEFGNLASIICWDADFPSIVKQIGKLNVDILCVPASDWDELVPAHAIVSAFRGIENGCSVVRQTRNGLSIITDARGKTITQMDHFKNKEWTMVGEVPTKKMFTLYPIIGDIFGWFSFLGLLILIFKAKYSKI